MAHPLAALGIKCIAVAPAVALQASTGRRGAQALDADEGQTLLTACSSVKYFPSLPCTCCQSARPLTCCPLAHHSNVAPVSGCPKVAAVGPAARATAVRHLPHCYRLQCSERAALAATTATTAAAATDKAPDAHAAIAGLGRHPATRQEALHWGGSSMQILCGS